MDNILIWPTCGSRKKYRNAVVNNLQSLINKELASFLLITIFR